MLLQEIFDHRRAHLAHIRFVRAREIAFLQRFPMHALFQLTDEPPVLTQTIFHQVIRQKLLQVALSQTTTNLQELRAVQHVKQDLADLHRLPVGPSWH